MAQWLDWIASEESFDDEPDFRQHRTFHEDASALQHRLREDDWENLWTDVGGEG